MPNIKGLDCSMQIFAIKTYNIYIIYKMMPIH